MKNEVQNEQETPSCKEASVEDFAEDVVEVAVENIVRDVVGTRMPLFDTHIIVDWSARSKRSPEKPTKDEFCGPAPASTAAVCRHSNPSTRAAATTPCGASSA